MPAVKIGAGIGLLLLMLLYSCTKNAAFADSRYDAYSLERDWYTMDTVFVNHAILWKDDSVYRKEDKMKLEAEPDRWLVMCETDNYPTHLEHWYYSKNGKRIHASAISH